MSDKLKPCPFCGAPARMNIGNFEERQPSCSDDNCGAMFGGGIWVPEGEEEKIISGYGFLSLKDLLIVLNLGEGQDTPEINYPCQVCVVSLQGQLEMEIAQLPPDDAELFMSEYDINEPSLNRMIRSSSN